MFYKEIIDLRDIRMAQILQDVHFPAEQVRPGRDLSFIRFQDHPLAKAQMVGQIDDSSPSGADFPDQFIS